MLDGTLTLQCPAPSTTSASMDHFPLDVLSHTVEVIGFFDKHTMAYSLKHQNPNANEYNYIPTVLFCLYLLPVCFELDIDRLYSLHLVTNTICHNMYWKKLRYFK